MASQAERITAYFNVIENHALPPRSYTDRAESVFEEHKKYTKYSQETEKLDIIFKRWNKEIARSIPDENVERTYQTRLLEYIKYHDILDDTDRMLALYQGAKEYLIPPDLTPEVWQSLQKLGPEVIQAIRVSSAVFKKFRQLEEQQRQVQTIRDRLNKDVPQLRELLILLADRCGKDIDRDRAEIRAKQVAVRQMESL
jgi:hypothetical protein